MESYFHQLGLENGEQFYTNFFFSFLYDYGPWPALALFSFSIIVLTLSFFHHNFVRFRKLSLLLFLTMAIGAGLMVHLLLKDQWGRPRPRQVIEFGGHQEYRPFYSPNFLNQPEPSKSFPCGHCSTGFYFFALALVFQRGGRLRYYRNTLIFALCYGSLIGLARMAQGGHFFSDVVFCAWIMWVIALSCNWFLYEWRVPCKG